MDLGRWQLVCVAFDFFPRIHPILHPNPPRELQPFIRFPGPQPIIPLQTTTFGTPGVREHCLFLKEVSQPSDTHTHTHTYIHTHTINHPPIYVFIYAWHSSPFHQPYIFLFWYRTPTTPNTYTHTHTHIPHTHPSRTQIPDAVQLRKAIVDRFERASMPSVSLEEKKRILSFVVVGGGAFLSFLGHSTWGLSGSFLRCGGGREGGKRSLLQWLWLGSERALDVGGAERGPTST
jgi:hypothetical protein